MNVCGHPYSLQIRSRVSKSRCSPVARGIGDIRDDDSRRLRRPSAIDATASGGPERDNGYSIGTTRAGNDPPTSLPAEDSLG
jgi:hypothetical protein